MPMLLPKMLGHDRSCLLPPYYLVIVQKVVVEEF